jgi:hypothetical protein
MKYAWKNSIKLINRNSKGSYIDGRTLKDYFCINCNKKISYNTWKYGKKRCNSCATKSDNNPAFKIGITLINHFCIDCGKKISLNNFLYGFKRCKSCSHKGKLSRRFGKPAPHGKGAYYKSIWMRSSYEIAYAKYLDKQGIKWEYELKTFDLGNCTYTPDFYLIDQDKYIEIKGYWRDNSKKKFKLFKKLYKDIKIKILYKKDLIDLKVLGD